MTNTQRAIQYVDWTAEYASRAVEHAQWAVKEAEAAGGYAREARKAIEQITLDPPENTQ